jgi:hypothetical protein
MTRTAMAALAVGLMSRVAQAVDITTCGQMVPANQVGTLVANLDCSGAPTGSAAVSLSNRSRLEMGVHSITTPPGGLGIACTQVRCAVTGSGAILTPPLDPGVGIYAVRNVTVSGGIEIHGLRVGILANEGRVKASDVALSNNQDAVIAKKVKGTNVFIRDSDRVGIMAARGVRGTHFEIRDSGWAAIQTRSFKLTELIATTNGLASTSVGGAIIAPRGGILIDSLLSANALNGVPADIVTGRRPILINTSCNVSVRLIDDSPSGSWGVCSGD